MIPCDENLKITSWRKNMNEGHTLVAQSVDLSTIGHLEGLPTSN